MIRSFKDRDTRRFLEGARVARFHAFAKQATFAERLRRSLGDWRDPITWPQSIWSDLGARADFYIDLGFDAHLTDLPAPAFREATAVTEVRSEPPPLSEAYVPPDSGSVEEAALARTNRAHDWLQRLESQLRRFIDHVMTDAFGPDWPTRQLPNNRRDQWNAKKEAADQSGAPPRPLIAYADFTDYVPIICAGVTTGARYSVRTSNARRVSASRSSAFIQSVSEPESTEVEARNRNTSCLISIRDHPVPPHLEPSYRLRPPAWGVAWSHQVAGRSALHNWL